MPKIRPPVVAGSFYPGHPATLESQIEKFLNNASAPKIEGEPCCLIVPHAGYIYSGQVAAFAYKNLIGQSFDGVIVLAPSHRVYFKGAALTEVEFYRTPLGEVRVKQEFNEAILNASPNFNINEEADRQEHSLEVEVPFLQTVLKDFELVPIVIGDINLASAKDIGSSLVQAVGEKKYLVVASSDLSHYHPAQIAEKMDKKALAAIEQGDVNGLMALVSSGASELCGIGPVLITMFFAEKIGANKIKLLKYGHSGEVTGDDSGVVGYGAVVFSK